MKVGLAVWLSGGRKLLMAVCMVVSPSSGTERVQWKIWVLCHPRLQV